MRDDFDKETKEVLARRVSYLCSNPNCRKPTSGPQTDPAKAINLGVAAHITAASPGGARYDSTLSLEQRKSIDNGIWLCQSCAKLVDNDDQRYTVDLLRRWKAQTEEEALSELENPSGRLTETATILSRLESLSSKGLSEITQSLSRIEDALKPLSGDASSRMSTSSGLTPKSTSNQGDLGYVILGLDDEEMYTWFSLFADTLPSNQNRETQPDFGELYFDDFTEMQDVFASLNKIVSRAKEAEIQGEDHQQSFERAWKEEAISRASLYAMEKIFKTQEPEGKKTTVNVPWLKYIIWGVNNHYNTIRRLRIKRVLEGEPPHNRNAKEVYFDNVATLLQIPAVLDNAVREANGHNKEFFRLLFEALMRLRTFGTNIP
jgi:hypothetical protein